jgi:hypothetical protein
MDRRSFLVGSGAILTSGFVDKANWFLQNKKAVVPFIELEKAPESIYFVDTGNQIYDLRLGIPEYGLPNLTYREWLETYIHPLNFGGKEITKDSFLKLMTWYEVEEDNLAEIAPYQLFHREWEVTDSPFAKAYSYLNDLPLFKDNGCDGELLGDLEFIHYDQRELVAVQSHDPLTASLLQARLLELDQNISVKIVKESQL